MMTKLLFTTQRTKQLMIIISLCLVLGQWSEIQHVHQQLSPECPWCVQSTALAADSHSPIRVVLPAGVWLLLDEYRQPVLFITKRGARDPPASSSV